jgi:hypothetical protein
MKAAGIALGIHPRRQGSVGISIRKGKTRE